MKSAAVAIDDQIRAADHNTLRQDAEGSSRLLATMQASPDLTVLVQAGVVYVGNTQVVYAGGNSPSVSAPATNPRIDVLTIDSAGTLAWTTGAEAGSPSPPTYPAGKVPICEIYVRVGSTAIHDTDQGSHAYIRRDVRPFFGKEIINAASQIVDAVLYSLVDGSRAYGVDAGGDDAYSATLTPPVLAYATGQHYFVKVATANTGACSLDLGPGVKDIKMQDGTDPATGVIAANSINEFLYDGTNMVLLTSAILSSGAASDATSLHKHNTLKARLHTLASAASAAEQTALSYTVPANRLGTKGAIRFRCSGTISGNYTGPTIKFKLGTTAFVSVTMRNPSTTSGSFWLDALIYNDGAANSQKYSYNGANITLDSGGGVSKYDVLQSGSTAAEDTTSSKAAEITYQKSDASAGLTLNQMDIEIVDSE